MTDRDSELKPRVTGTDLAQRGLEALDVTDYEKIPAEMKPVKGEINAVDWMQIMELGKALAGMNISTTYRSGSTRTALRMPWWGIRLSFKASPGRCH